MRPPWDHHKPRCPLCHLHHGTTVHHHLPHRLRWKVAFCTMWISTWGPWKDYVTEWWSRATPKDLHQASCLHIPDSLWCHLPPGYGAEF